MPTVLSKHKGELFGERINVKVNLHWYICQKVIWHILTVLRNAVAKEQTML